MSKKVQFKGGWWAEIKTEFEYGSDSRIAGVWTFLDTPEKFTDACNATLEESVITAHVPDPAGNAIPYAKDIWPRVNGRIARRVLQEARTSWANWQDDTDPKDMQASSEDTPQESPSEQISA